MIHDRNKYLDNQIYKQKEPTKEKEERKLSLVPCGKVLQVRSARLLSRAQGGTEWGGTEAQGVHVENLMNGTPKSLGG